MFPRPSWNYGDEYTEADRYDDDYNYDEEDKFGYYRSPPRGQRGPPPRSILKHRGSPPPPQIGPRTIPQNSGSRVTINVRPQRRESGSEDEEEYERDASSDIIDREQYKQPSAASEGGDDSNDDQKAGDAVPAEEELKAAKRGTEETSGATKKDESRGTDEA